MDIRCWYYVEIFHEAEEEGPYPFRFIDDGDNQSIAISGHEQVLLLKRQDD